ncbi:thiamine pyrophosphate-binding protein [Kocuria sp. WRN011]|uniref:thiamine pyrophosphate-binding protein n=1 Tax=Kocuria sp. WRN011 TaxID=2029858 RepID=UPI0020B11C3D|nr:thiamine pyrophosphate-binding protein [Kocuria sp. WRN011]
MAPSGTRPVAHVVGTVLAELGAGHCFGVVGSGNFEMTAALRRAGVPFTAARHEGGAAMMADGFARMSGRVAVLSTHQGCGLTNALTGIAEAAKSRTPLIVLTADTASAAVRSNFNVDQDALARSVSAVPERVHSPASAVADVVRAYRTTLTERRTVVLSVPTDIQQAKVDFDPALLPTVSTAQPVRPSRQAVAELAQLITKAKKPVFVAGRGARHAADQLRELAEASGALLATSAVAHGLFHDDPFNLGISGGFSSPFTAATVADADLIVGWGCALNMWTMRHGSLIGPEATVVQVDTDLDALGANRPIDLGVLGDCAESATDVTKALSGVGGDTWRTPEMAQRIKSHARWASEAIEDLSTETHIDPRVFSREVDKLLPVERVVSVDSGNFMGYPSAYLDVPDEFGFCFTQAFQSIGLGLGTAIGAAIAQPERLPVLATGDGGFLMAISELETAVRLGLPLVVLVYNDSAYGAEIHHFDQASNKDLETVTFPDTDIAAIARGYGAHGVTVRTVADLSGITDWLNGARDTLLVVDARIASDGGAWWLAEAFKGH